VRQTQSEKIQLGAADETRWNGSQIGHDRFWEPAAFQTLRNAAAICEKGVAPAMETNTDQIREAVAVFQKVGDLEAAIDELLSSGFDRAELSLLGSKHAVEVKLGSEAFRTIELEDNPSAPRGSYVSPAAMGAAEGGLVGAFAYLGALVGLIALAGGPLTLVVVGTVLAGGGAGLIGTGFAELVGHRRAAYFQDQLDRGGLLLWVRARDTLHEKRAIEILARNAGDDVHVHAFALTNEREARAPAR
jgi:hypothetical protein